MKSKLEKQQWYCFGGNHYTVGNRYANHHGNFDCWKHTAYLQK